VQAAVDDGERKKTVPLIIMVRPSTFGEKYEPVPSHAPGKTCTFFTDSKCMAIADDVNVPV
jgi:hypothetical protein